LLNDNNFNSSNEFEIIDGQQRLTSLLILLSVLSQRPDTKFSLSELIRNDSIENNVYFLTFIHQIDSNFLCAIINNDDLPTIASKSQKLMEETKKIFNEEINAAICDNMFSSNIEYYPNYILNNVKFLVHYLNDKSFANLMFESINSRGLALEFFDRIKSLLLHSSNYHHNSTFDKKIISIFEKIYQFLDNGEFVLDINNDDNLLKYHYQSAPNVFSNLQRE